MKKVIILLVLFTLAGPSSAFAGFSSGGGFKSSGGSSFKSSSGSKPSSGSKSYSAPKPAYSVAKPTLAKPSTGPKQQPLPTAKLVPTVIPTRTFPKSGTTKTYVPAGLNYTNDRNILVNNPRYVNPYGSGYYGFYDSPFYYIWLFSILDDDQSNNPLPPQSDEGKIAPIIPSELGVISALVDEVQSK
jgi:hypothetical protein